MMAGQARLVGFLAFFAMLAIPLLASVGCNIHEEQDDLDRWAEWSAHFYSGAADSGLNQQEQIESYQRARRLAMMQLERDPDNIMASLMLGFTTLKLGPWTSTNPNDITAESVFEDILIREPKNYRANLGRGIVYFKVARGKFRPRLDRLDRALTGTDELIEAAQQARADVEEDSDSTEAIANVAVRFERYARDIRNYLAGDEMPAIDAFRSLVDPASIHGTSSGSAAEARSVATPLEVRQAIADRVDDILDAADRAQSAMPSDYTTFLANIDRVRLILQTAYNTYRDQYTGELDDALHHFHICEELHAEYGRIYHWVFEYMAMTYLLKSSVLPKEDGAAGVVGDPSLRMQYLRTSDRYLERFIVEDLTFERRRLEKLANPEIAELEASDYWTTTIQDYRGLMRSLIDEGRVHRRGLIQLRIDYYLHDFEEFGRAREFCDQMYDAEIMLTDERDPSLQPYRHHFFRAEGYRFEAEAMEEDWPVNALGEPEVPASAAEEHERLWLQAYREYRNFLIRSSSDERDGPMRTRSREALTKVAGRYPSITENSVLVPTGNQ